MEDLVMFILGEVTVSEQTAGILCIFFSQQTLSKEGGIRRNMMMKWLVDSLDQLSL